MSKEDELLQQLMSSVEGEWKAEVHYNHYGTRGVLDAVRETDLSVTLYELKSACAVNNATGANEIIRQVNRHREYYYQDHQTRKDKSLQLVFTLSQETWDHVKENIQLYANLTSRTPDTDVPVTVEIIRSNGRRIQPAHPKVGHHTDRWEEQLEYRGKGFFEGTEVNP